MALAKELNVNDQGPLSDESSGKPYGEIIRDYEAVPGVQWRFGKPNYARVNKLYFEYRTKIHPEGSLESVVSKLVKNWEAAVNGGVPASAQLIEDSGPYNLLIGDTPLYKGSSMTFEESNALFGGCFADGFAFEGLEVLSGPPTVTFKWRHFGKFSGVYTESIGMKHHGNGDMLNLIGLCIAKVTLKFVRCAQMRVRHPPVRRPASLAARSSSRPWTCTTTPTTSSSRS